MKHARTGPAPGAAPLRAPISDLAAVAAISAAALAYEVLLTRLFAIVQWHHFAHMVISVALLGYGASGTLLVYAGRRLLRRYEAVFAGCTLAFAVTALAGFLLAQRLPFNALEVAWHWGPLGWLLLMELLLTVPFLCAATAVGLALMRFRGQEARVYAVDLVGAGFGAVAVIGLLHAVLPSRALEVVACTAAFASVLLGWRHRLSTRSRAAAAVVFVVLLIGLPADWGGLAISQFKALPQALQVGAAKVTRTASSPLGLIHVVENETVPFRHAPGLSFLSPTHPPKQTAVFIDGDGPATLSPVSATAPELDYLDYLVTAMPYHLVSEPRVLVLDSMGDEAIRQALHLGARHVDAVAPDPTLVEVFEQTLAGGDAAMAERVTWHAADARAFVAATNRRYDIVQLTLGGSHAAAAAGLYSLHANARYTVQAIASYLSRLQTGGYLAMSHWIKLPPRDGVRLFASVVQALEQAGIEAPARRVVWLRSWSTAAIVVKNGEFSPEELARVDEFATRRAFDVAYAPGMVATAANRFNVLDQAYYYDAAGALLDRGRRDQFLSRYKFAADPSTDDRPYFYNFFKWSSIAELLALRTRGGIGLLEVGYLLLLGTLVHAALGGALLLAVALVARRHARSEGHRSARQWRGTFCYFFAIGLGFMFIEFAFIQRCSLFLGHPVYGVTLVLTGFLVLAGAGSATLQRFGTLVDRAWWPGTVMPLVAVLTLGAAVVSSPLFAHFSASALAVKVAMALVVIAPIAYCMGMPFPMGLGALQSGPRSLVAWAWAVNGCASVVGAVLAMVLSIHLGLNALLAIGAACYVAAWLARDTLSGSAPSTG